MELINFAIHRNVAPALPETPFQSKSAPNDVIITLTAKFNDEAKALSFASDMLKTVEHYKE